MTQRYEKLSPTTHKVLSQISSILECLMYGESANANFLCRSMMLSLSNIPKSEKRKLLNELDDSFLTLSDWIEEEISSSPTE